MATTLLTNAFNAAIAYWRNNNGGTRAGLISNLQAEVGINSATATRWVDAMTSESFNIGLIDDITYATFKSWMIKVGVTRALGGITCVFENLRESVLLQESKDEKLSQKDELIAALDVDIVSAAAAVTAITSQSPSAARTTALTALAVYQSKLNRIRATLVRDRATVVAE